MTTTTSSTTPYPVRRSQGGGVFILIILFTMVLLAAIKVTLRPHAVEQHPDTAPLTRDCIQKNGIWKVYQEPRPTDNVFHWLCKDPATGTIFDMVVEKINESLYKERTSFEPKGGKWDTIFRWLEGKRGGKWQNPPSGPFELIKP